MWSINTSPKTEVNIKFMAAIFGNQLWRCFGWQGNFMKWRILLSLTLNGCCVVLLTAVWEEFGINFLEGFLLDNSAGTFLCEKKYGLTTMK